MAKDTETPGIPAVDRAATCSAWFCRTPDGFDLYDTAADAKAAAEAALNEARDEATSGEYAEWPFETDEIMWGQIHGAATEFTIGDDLDYALVEPTE